MNTTASFSFGDLRDAAALLKPVERSIVVMSPEFAAKNVALVDQCSDLSSVRVVVTDMVQDAHIIPDSSLRIEPFAFTPPEFPPEPAWSIRTRLEFPIIRPEGLVYFTSVCDSDPHFPSNSDRRRVSKYRRDTLLMRRLARLAMDGRLARSGMLRLSRLLRKRKFVGASVFKHDALRMGKDDRRLAMGCEGKAVNGTK